jgi:hypothetical protein
VKTCPWCGIASEDESRHCVECGREFRPEDKHLLRINGPKPELPYPVSRCLLAFFAIIAYYFFLAFSWGAAGRFLSRFGLPKIWVPATVSLGFLEMLLAFLIIPASFYFLAFLPLVLREEDITFRRRCWTTAIVRSLFLAFVTPFFLFMLYSLVRLLLSFYS